MIAFAVLLSLAVIASAHDDHGRGYGWRQGSRVRALSGRRYARPVRVVTVRGPMRVLGARYYNHDNYGRRRSALAHHQNAERHLLHRHFKQERRLARYRGLDRRELARHQREERRMLRRHHRAERMRY